jgi:hypothetical protein
MEGPRPEYSAELRRHFADLRDGTHGGGVEAIWALSWPGQRAGGINPIAIRAYYSAGAHHPHLQAGTAGDWPLNVFDDKQAAAELRPCARWPQPTCTTWSSSVTTASFRPS